jgi:ABC-2 type transport system permease protein
LLTAPAFGFMGIGFPRLGMNAFSYGYGALLPGTWYLTARVDQTVRGTPLDLSWKPVLILLAFAVGLAGLVAWKLESIRASAHRSSGRTAPQSPAEVFP